MHKRTGVKTTHIKTIAEKVFGSYIVRADIVQYNEHPPVLTIERFDLLPGGKQGKHRGRPPFDLEMIAWLVEEDILGQGETVLNESIHLFQAMEKVADRQAARV